MAYNGIYVTPNQVVANKNRKTKFEELLEEVNVVNNSTLNIRNKLKNLLEEYSKDVKIKYHKNWEIINIGVRDSWFELEMKDCWGDPIIRQLPKDWLDNRNQYLIQIEQDQLQIHAKNIKEDIERRKIIVNKITAEIKNLENELKDVENNKLLDSICTK